MNNNETPAIDTTTCIMCHDHFDPEDDGLAAYVDPRNGNTVLVCDDCWADWDAESGWLANFNATH